MEEYALGPNGGLLFCMEFLLKNVDWLFSRLDKYPSIPFHSVGFLDHYVLFDFPGQVELFTANDNIKVLLERMEKQGFRVVPLFPVDCSWLP